jgi:hypothetical protein
MNKMRQLAPPRRGIVWASNPATSEFPDASDYDNHYVAQNGPAQRPSPSASTDARKAAVQGPRRASVGAFFHAYLATFRQVVLG